MNKHGFTLVELLATIVILGLLAGMATISYTAFVKSSAEKVYESYEDTMHAEAVYKLTMHYSDVSFSGNKATLSLQDLAIEPFNNPDDKGNTCSSSFVEVTKSTVNGVLSFHYKVCLKCPHHNSDGNNCREYEN